MRSVSNWSWNTPRICWSEAILVRAYLIAFTPIVLSTMIESELAKLLGGALESRIIRPALADGARLDGIIVLGGSPARVSAAVALAQQFPGVPVVLSGPGEPEIALANREMGLGAKLWIDRRATTTYENALYSKDLVAPRTGQCWAVVTSAVHMPRAIGAFQAVGFPVLPWPVADTPTMPEALSATVWHEVIGLVGYWVAGRSSHFCPHAEIACGLEVARPN